MSPLLLALLGYALGTAQVLFVDWVRRRRRHEQHLLYLKAELEAVLEHCEPHDWDPESWFKSDYMARPPTPTGKLLDITSQTEFHLTDVEGDFDARHAMIETMDGCDLLQRYDREIHKLIDEYDATDCEDRKRELRGFMTGYLSEYNEKAPQLAEHVQSLIEGLEARIKEVRYEPQVTRSLKHLPDGLREDW